MQYFDISVARRALALWPEAAGPVTPIGMSGNTVFRVAAADGAYALRLTDPRHRSLAHLEAETAFVRFLAAAGLPVGTALPSAAGRLVETVHGCYASLFKWCPGAVLTPADPGFTAAVAARWGRLLAALHDAARRYRGARPWYWHRDPFMVGAHRRLEGDRVVRRRLEIVYTDLASRPRTAAFGIVHADLHPRNFHVTPGGEIHVFDFGNCCQHWFAADLAVAVCALSERASQPLQAVLLDAYRDADDRAIDRTLLARLIELRALYVYLSRLKLFGPRPDPGQRSLLDSLRERALRRGEDWLAGAHTVAGVAVSSA